MIGGTIGVPYWDTAGPANERLNKIVGSSSRFDFQLWWTWERQLSGTAARRGWQSDALRGAEADRGVDLELNILRKIRVYEHHKPWNRGRLATSGWRSVNTVKRDYARYTGGSCAAYPIGTRSLHYAVYPAPFSPPPSAGPEEVPLSGPHFLYH